MSDGTIWNVALELSIVILEVSFTLMHGVYITGVSYEDCQLTINIIITHVD